MALEVKRQGRETSQGLVRRFGQRLQRSGVLIRARRTRFKTRNKSEQTKKREALRREELRKEYQKLEKLGKLPAPRRRR
jgi:hypothetical protein